jgi:hypothetical protein
VVTVEVPVLTHAEETVAEDVTTVVVALARVAVILSVQTNVRQVVEAVVQQPQELEDK